MEHLWIRADRMQEIKWFQQWIKEDHSKLMLVKIAEAGAETEEGIVVQILGHDRFADHVDPGVDVKVEEAEFLLLLKMNWMWNQFV